MSEKINIRAGGVNEHFNLPWIKLSEKNSSEKKYEFHWKNFAGGTGVLTSALHENEIDWAVLLTEGLILDIIKNNKLKLVCFHVKNPLRWGIHVRKSEFTNEINYSGKKFAVSRLGSGSHTMAKFLLNENGIMYDENKMIEAGSLEGGLQSLKKSESDVFLWEKFTTEPFLEESGLKCIGEVKTPWPPFSVAVRRDFYKNNHTVISEILSEVKILAKNILDDSNTVNEIHERWNITIENANRWLAEIIWDDVEITDEKTLFPVLRNMKKAGLISNQENLILNS